MKTVYIDYPDQEDYLDYIPLRDCKHGYLYTIDARNAGVGVFDKKSDGFIIARHDYMAGDIYLFTEYHWDNNDGGCGTAKPLREIEEIPEALELDSNELLDYLLWAANEYSED